jgi:MFS family permease
MFFNKKELQENEMHATVPKVVRREPSPTVILGICFVMQVLCGGMISNLVGVSADDISRTLALSKVSVLLLTSSLFYMSLAIFTLAVGFTARRFSRKSGLAAACIAVAIGFIIVANSTRPWHLAVAYGLFFGFGFANMQLATNTLVVQWFDQRRGAALGFLAMGVSSAGVILAPVYAYLDGQFDWRFAISLLAALALVPLVPVLFLIHEKKPAGSNPQHLSDSTTANPPTGRWGHLARPPLWAMAISSGMCSLTIMAVLSNLRRIASESGQAPSSITLLFSTLSMSAILGKLLFMCISHRLTQRQIGVFPLVAVTFGCLMVSQASSFGPFVAAVAAFGLAFGITTPGLSAVLAEHFHGRDFMPAAGVCMTISTLGVILGPPAVAALREVTGGFAPIFTGMAIALPFFILPVLFFLPSNARCTGVPSA